MTTADMKMIFIVKEKLTIMYLQEIQSKTLKNRENALKLYQGL